MRLYQHISGQNLGRLAALSDGIFAVAMTLLVLNIAIPTVGVATHAQQPIWAPGALASEATVWNALVPLGPHLLTYLMSFLTLGIFWAGQQTQLNYFARSDHRLTWIHLVFLLAVVFMPFSTALLAEYTELGDRAPDRPAEPVLRLAGSDVGASDLAFDAWHGLRRVDVEVGIVKARLEQHCAVLVDGDRARDAARP